jgi:hypothetical protein
MAGGAGELPGPFARLEAAEQAIAIQAMLSLPDDIDVPDPRLLVPEMVAMHQRHSELNVLNVEAAAAARLLDARVLLSPRAADGVLPEVLTLEGITWRVVDVGHVE